MPPAPQRPSRPPRPSGPSAVGHWERSRPVPADRSGAARSGAARSGTARSGTARSVVLEETSAGGLVVDLAYGVPRVAVIARINRAGRLEWCLPKGHLEGSETPEEAAVREIEEETGIRGRVLRELGTIDYWFSAEGRRIHKTVHHYLLQATGGALTVEGDPDAEAVDAAWVPVSELGTRLAFGNERRIARMARDALSDIA